MNAAEPTPSHDPKIHDFVLTYRSDRGKRRPCRGQIMERRHAFVMVAYYFRYENGGDVVHGFRTLRRRAEEVVVVPRLPGELSPYEKIDKALGIKSAVQPPTAELVADTIYGEDDD